MAEQRRRLLRDPAEVVVVLVAASILGATVWTATEQAGAPPERPVVAREAGPSPSLVGAHVSGRSSARGPVTGLHERSPLPTPDASLSPVPAATATPHALSEWLTAQVPRTRGTSTGRVPRGETAAPPETSRTPTGSPTVLAPSPNLGPPATVPSTAPSVTAPSPAETSTPPSPAPPAPTAPAPSAPAPSAPAPTRSDLAPPGDGPAPPTTDSIVPDGDAVPDDDAVPDGDAAPAPETAVVTPGA